MVFVCRLCVYAENLSCHVGNLGRTVPIFTFSDPLTHLSLASLLWDIGKQNSPRCDAAECGVPSGAILFA